MSMIPASKIIADKDNHNFVFNPTDEKSFEEYLKATTDFLAPQSLNIRKQFTEEYLRNHYAQGKVIYFIKLNKIIGWEPIGYPSPEAIVDAGYANQDGVPNLQFKDDDFQANGVYFYCNTTRNSNLDIQFLKIDGHYRKGQSTGNHGWIPLNEYKMLRKTLDENASDKYRTASDPSALAPFVAVSVSAKAPGQQEG